MSIEHHPGKARPTRLAYGVKAFCAEVGIGRTKFYQLVHDGQIKVVKLGSKSLVTGEEASRFLDTLEQKTA